MSISNINSVLKISDKEKIKIPVSDKKNQKIEIKFTKDAEKNFQDALQYLSENSNASESDYQNSYADVMGLADKKAAQGEKDLWDRYTDGWREDFKDADSVNGVINAVVNRTRKGFKAMDTLNPLTYVKEPIKNISGKIDKLLDDGSDNTISVQEGIWESVKGVGDIVDYATTTEGLWTAAAAYTGLGAIGKVAQYAPKLATTVNYTFNGLFGTAGGVITTKGIYDVSTAQSKNDIRAGAAEIVSGGLLLGGTALSVKSNLKSSRIKLPDKFEAESQKFAQTVKKEFEFLVKTQNALEKGAIPPARFKAPTAKFAETDDAFVNIIRNSKDEFIALNKKDGDEFIKSAYELIKNKMGMGDAPIKLKITNDNESFADAENAIVSIARNWKNGDKSEIIGAIAHELNHMIQYKEMFVNSLILEKSYKFDKDLENWMINKDEYFNPDTHLFNKAEVYRNNWENYVELKPDHSNYSLYRNQPVEAESHIRGDLVRDEFKKLNSYKNNSFSSTEIYNVAEKYNLDVKPLKYLEQSGIKLDDLEMKALSKIVKVVNEKNNLNNFAGCRRLNEAYKESPEQFYMIIAEELKLPHVKNYSVDKFTEFFIEKFGFFR